MHSWGVLKERLELIVCPVVRHVSKSKTLQAAMEPDAIKECACCRFASLASVISAILQAAHQSQSALLWPLRGRLTMQIKPVESRGAPKERRTGPGIHSLAAQDTLDEWRAELYEGDRQHFGAVPEAGPASQCLAEIAFPQPSWAASALKEEGPLTVYTWKDYFKHTNIKGIQSQIHFFFTSVLGKKEKKNNITHTVDVLFL